MEIIVHNWVHFTLQFYTSIVFLTSIASILALYTSNFYIVRTNVGNIATLFVAPASAYVSSCVIKLYGRIKYPMSSHRIFPK
jgi:hypothetical protein